MTIQSVAKIVQALRDANVRYLIVGGLAVAAHGYLRFTADIDLVLDPDAASIRRAIAVLGALGYRPRAPVPFEDFADPANRRVWQRDKGMMVFAVQSPEHPATEIDLFLEPPFDFEQAYGGALRQEVGPGVPATFVSRAQLIAMKRAVGRPQDLIDAEKLEHGDREGEPK